MKLGVLTYNIPHRKTYDTLCLLRTKGYKNVNVYAIPLHYEKHFKPIYEHRPAINEYIPDTKSICLNFGYKYHEGSLDNFNIPSEEIILVCGAGILPEKFIFSHKVINSHPGYIPLCRGLDAFKWAIYEGKPIGVTTHLLGEYIDAGEVIERRIIPVKHNDTFHAVAQRIYEAEIGMLVDAIDKINDKHDLILPEDNIVHKRMPHEYELRLIERFNELVKKVPIEE